MESKYFRSYAEGMDGEEGHFYCEVLNEKIVKQIYSLENELYWATLGEENNEQYFFTDQPEFPDSEIPRLVEEFDLEELSKEEFIQVWEKAQDKEY